MHTCTRGEPAIQEHARASQAHQGTEALASYRAQAPSTSNTSPSIIAATTTTTTTPTTTTTMTSTSTTTITTSNRSTIRPGPGAPLTAVVNIVQVAVVHPLLASAEGAETFEARRVCLRLSRSHAHLIWPRQFVLPLVRGMVQGEVLLPHCCIFFRVAGAWGLCMDHGRCHGLGSCAHSPLGPELAVTYTL